jgi:hypothetical protein
MINLLPDDSKKQITAARSNVILLNYMIVLFLAIVFLTTVTVVVYFILLHTKTNAENLVLQNQSKTSSYNLVQAQAKTLHDSLVASKVIIDEQVTYSKIILGIANAMPDGVVIDTLTLSPTTIGTPTTLQIYAKSNQAALELKSRFQQSSLFSNVSFTVITTTTGGSTSGYPINATLQLTINKVKS